MKVSKFQLRYVPPMEGLKHLELKMTVVNKQIRVVFDGFCLFDCLLCFVLFCFVLFDCLIVCLLVFNISTLKVLIIYCPANKSGEHTKCTVYESGMAPSQ